MPFGATMVRALLLGAALSPRVAHAQPSEHCTDQDVSTVTALNAQCGSQTDPNYATCSQRELSRNTGRAASKGQMLFAYLSSTAILIPW